MNSLNTVKNLSVKIIPYIAIRDACGTWHEFFTLTSIRRNKKQPENWEQVARWQKIEVSKERVGRASNNTLALVILQQMFNELTFQLDLSLVEK